MAQIRYKITALKDVTVTAYVWFQGSVELPPGIQGQSQGQLPLMRNAEKTFKLRNGESRTDISFLVSVSDSELQGPHWMSHWTHPLPAGAVGDRSQDGGMLQVERLE